MIRAVGNVLVSTPGFDFSHGVDTLRDELLSPSWCMNNSACRGSASYMMRSRPDPYKGSDPSHNPAQYSDLCDGSQCCAWPQCSNMLDDEMFGQLLFEFS